jgi:hypothetical protein
MQHGHAYFNDPIWAGLFPMDKQNMWAKLLGTLMHRLEFKIDPYSGFSGCIMSFGSFCLFPTCIAELGGVRLSLWDNRICRYLVQTEGGLNCKDRDGFNSAAVSCSVNDQHY